VARSPGGVLDDGDLLFSQSVKLVDKSVDLPVSRLDLAPEEGLLGAGLRLRKPPVQVEHILDEAHHRRRVAGEVHRGYNSYIELLKYDLKYITGRRP